MYRIILQNEFQKAVWLFAPELLWFLLKLRVSCIHTWSEYHSLLSLLIAFVVRKNINFRTFHKQDTKSKFFEMETEFESRWQTKIRLRPFSSFPPPTHILTPFSLDTDGEEAFFHLAVVSQRAFLLSLAINIPTFYLIFEKRAERRAKCVSERQDGTLNEFSSINV